MVLAADIHIVSALPEAQAALMLDNKQGTADVRLSGATSVERAQKGTGNVGPWRKQGEHQ